MTGPGDDCIVKDGNEIGEIRKRERRESAMEKQLYTKMMESPLGEIVLVSDGTALKEVRLTGQRENFSGMGKMSSEESCPVLEMTKRWLTLYFSGEIPDFLPPLAPEGSAFRQRVWEILLEIPYGQVTSYGEIAARMAAETGKKQMSAQAVGGAVGHNPIAIIIPCHRVVGKDGSMTGYDGGVEKKIWLLQLEGGHCAQRKF